MKDKEFMDKVKEGVFARELQEIRKRNWSSLLKRKEQESKKEVMQVRMIIVLLLFTLLVFLIF